MEWSLGQIVYNLRHMRRSEKILISFLLALVISITSSKTIVSFFDTFVMVFFYAVWLLLALPSLYRRLTPKFVKTLLYTFVETFMADLVVFGLYRYTRRHMTEADVNFDAVEQRGCMFVMNGIRLLFLAFCLLRAFMPPNGSKSKVRGRRPSGRKQTAGRSWWWW